MDKALYSIIIPVYNSSASLVEIVEGIESEFADNRRLPYEIILVDDGSKNEETGKTLQSIFKSHNNVKVIFLRKNFGQHAALLCGMKHSRGDYVITMDDDMQHSPKVLPQIIELKEHDVVYARFKEVKASLSKRMTSRLRNRINQIAFGKPGILISSFALYKRALVDEFLKMDKSYPMLGSMAFSITNDIVNTEIPYRKRKEGRSGYSFRKLFRLFDNIIFGHTVLLPKILILFSAAIFVLALVAIILFVYFMPGSSFIVLFIYLLFFFGLSAILAGIGIVAEYLRRIYSTAQKKPLYVIREILDKEGNG